jgi:hypothetical protein
VRFRTILRQEWLILRAALKDLIRAAVALNLKGKNQPKVRRASSKRGEQVCLTSTRLAQRFPASRRGQTTTNDRLSY